MTLTKVYYIIALLESRILLSFKWSMVLFVKCYLFASPSRKKKHCITTFITTAQIFAGTYLPPFQNFTSHEYLFTTMYVWAATLPSLPSTCDRDEKPTNKKWTHLKKGTGNYRMKYFTVERLCYIDESVSALVFEICTQAKTGLVLGGRWHSSLISR